MCDNCHTAVLSPINLNRNFCMKKTLLPRLAMAWLLIAIIQLLPFTALAENKICYPTKHAKVPIVNELTYHKARKKLLATGWQPSRQNLIPPQTMIQMFLQAMDRFFGASIRSLSHVRERVLRRVPSYFPMSTAIVSESSLKVKKYQRKKYMRW